MCTRAGVDLTVTINDIHIIDDVFAVIKLLQKRHPTIVTTASYRHSAISSASVDSVFCAKWDNGPCVRARLTCDRKRGRRTMCLCLILCIN